MGEIILRMPSFCFKVPCEFGPGFSTLTHLEQLPFLQVLAQGHRESICSLGCVKVPKSNAKKKDGLSSLTVSAAQHCSCLPSSSAGVLQSICHFPFSFFLSSPLKFAPNAASANLLHPSSADPQDPTLWCQWASGQCYRTCCYYILASSQCYQLRCLLLKTKLSPWSGRVCLLLLSPQSSRPLGFSPQLLAAVWLVSSKVYPPVLESSISCTDVLQALFSHHRFLILLLFPALILRSLTCGSTAHVQIPAQSQHPSLHPPGLPCCCHPDVSWEQLPPHWWGQTGLWAQSWQSTVGRWTAGCWGSSGHRGCSRVRYPWEEVGFEREWWKEGRTKVRMQVWLIFLSKNTNATGKNRAMVLSLHSL